MATKKPTLPVAVPQEAAPAMPQKVTERGGNLPASAAGSPTSAPVVPWEEKSKGERLGSLVDLSLEQNRRILSMEFDPNDLSPGNLKRISIISNTALQTIAQQARLDEAALKASQNNNFDLNQFYRDFGAAEPKGQGDDDDE